MQKPLSIFILLFIGFSSISQVNIDSLWNVWNDKEKPDTNRLGSLMEIIFHEYLFSQPDSAFYFAQLQYDFAKSVKNKIWISKALNIQGVTFHVKSNYNEALFYYKKSLTMAEKIGYREGMANNFVNIGSIYHKQNNYEEALLYYNKSLELTKETDDKRGMAASFHNIGSIYKYKGDYEEALKYYKMDLEISEDIGDQHGIAYSLNDIGVIHSSQGNLKKALINYKKGLQISKNIEDQRLISISLGNIGNLYNKQGNYQQALIILLKALRNSKEINAYDRINENSNTLYNIYKKIGDTKNALDMFELYVASKDTLAKKDAKEAAIEMKYQHRYETKAKLDSLDNLRIRQLKDKEIYKQKAELEAKKNQQIMLYGGMGLVIIFSIFILNRFRVTKHQKMLIEQQKEKVEEKNMEILGSIQYAKQLQDAILPPIKIVKEHLSQSFIFYRPKDIVAGDFYWIENLDGWVYFAAADCTGHGVPGAMVSVVCSNTLSKAVIEEKINTPAVILNRARELVIERFERSERQIKDGMDISLCAIEPTSGKIKWAGAHNPLWIIRNESKEIEVIKADTQPIGRYATNEPFTAHSLQLNKGDSMYLFTDGFSDQFGGKKNKKYKAANFKRFLLSIQDKDMDAQHQLIGKEFDQWKGDLEQIDDVCVMGVRV